MSKKTSYLLGMLLTIIIGTLSYYFLCDISRYGGSLNSENDGMENVADPPIVHDKQMAFDSFSMTENDVAP